MNVMRFLMAGLFCGYRGVVCRCWLIAYCFFSFASPVSASEEAPEVFSLESIDENQLLIAKKPDIRWTSSLVLSDVPVLVLLDGVDVSSLVKQKGNRFSFRPVAVLPSGEHNLYISAIDSGGNPVEQEFFFRSRQSERFEEAYSSNELSIVYRGVVDHRSKEEQPPPDPAEAEWINDDAFAEEEGKEDTFPDHTVNAYLATDSVIREGNWTTSFTGNVRYFDQDAAILEPEKSGLNLIDILLTTGYSGEKLSMEIGLGDNGIQESRNTVDNLYRRGLKASLKYSDYTVNTFAVLGDEQYNELSELGLRFNSNDHIMGASVQVDFFDNQMFVKAVYVNGGESGDALGYWSEGGGRKVDVMGLLFFTDFFAGQLTTEIEYDEANTRNSSTDLSSFSAPEDDFGTDSSEAVDDAEFSDKAYRIVIAGMKNIYNYELSYEYTGPEYEVVGNQGLVRDRAGYSFVGGAAFEYHNVNLFGSSFWDDVDDDPLYQRLTSMGGGIEYSYLGWLRFPFSIRYERGSQRSKDEPEDLDETAVDLDSVETRLGYQDGPWMVEVMAAFSTQNDKGPQDLDNELISLFVSPGYGGDFLTIMPSWSYNSSKDLQTSIRTDTHTWTLDLQSLLFAEKLLCEIGGTYDRSTSSDGTMDDRSFQGYARATYRFQTLWNLLSPSFGLEYSRSYRKDEVAGTLFQEDIVTATLSSTLPYSF